MEKLRLWLVRQIARWCGLRVGVVAYDADNQRLMLIVLTRNDALTRATVAGLAGLYEDADVQPDARMHQEWTH